MSGTVRTTITTSYEKTYNVRDVLDALDVRSDAADSPSLRIEHKGEFVIVRWTKRDTYTNGVAD